MNIIPWRRRGDSIVPFSSEMEHLWNRLWGDENGESFTSLPAAMRQRPFPSVNIAETEDSIRITCDLPGLEESDIEVETMGNQLLITGERKWQDEKKGKEFHRIESQYGKFERAVMLPDNARTDPADIDAQYRKGVLTIRVPKLEKTPTKKIPVHAE